MPRLKPYYQDALTTLYHADARAIADHLPRPAVIATDPPYGIRYCAKATYGGRRGEQSIVGDETDALMRFIAERWPDVPLAMFASPKMPSPFVPNTTLVWDKGEGAGMGDLAMPWKPNWEVIHIRGRTWHGRRTSGVLRYPLRGRRTHPNEKPVELLAELISKAPKGLVLDPCAGSGSTLLAARQLGREVVGVEVDERWAEVAARRLAAR